MTEGSTVKDILDRLNQLSPPQIADYLRDKGVRGVLMDPSSCPIARWVKENTIDRPKSVWAYPVSGVRVDYVLSTDLDAILETDMIDETPQNVREFMYGFDQCRYPELVEEETDGDTNG